MNMNQNPFASFGRTEKSRITVTKFVSKFDGSTKFAVKVRNVDTVLGGFAVPCSNAEYYMSSEAEVNNFISALNSVGIF